MKFKIVRINTTGKEVLLEQVIEELDSLYDDLTYENSEEEIACIKSKIKIRETLIFRLS